MQIINGNRLVLFNSEEYKITVLNLKICKFGNGNANTQWHKLLRKMFVDKFSLLLRMFVLMNSYSWWHGKMLPDVSS